MGIYKLIEKKKKEQKRKKVMEVAKVVTASTVLGATAGVLLAPKSGKETREDIKIKSGEIAGKVKEKSLDAKGKIGTKVESSKADFKEAKDKVKEYLAKRKNCESEVELDEVDNEEVAHEENSKEA